MTSTTTQEAAMRDEPTKEPREHIEDPPAQGEVPEDAVTDLAPDEAEQSGIAGGMRKSGGDPY
jgi:hypothetical protein